MKTSDVHQRVPLSMRHPVHAVPEVGISLMLGLRDGIRPRLALSSVLAGLVAFGFWLIVFVVWRSEIWALADLVAKGAMNGVLSLIWSDSAGASAEAASGATTTAPFWDKAVTRIATPLGSIVNFLLVAASFALLVMLSMRLYLELFLMGRVQQQCVKHYPSLSGGAERSFHADVRSTITQLAILGAGVLLLVIPVIGGILFFLLASYLNVRGLVNDALEDLATIEERRAIVQTMRVPMLLLGMAITGLLLIPLAGLFIPAILGASVCHLCMRALIRLRAPMAQGDHGR